MHTCILSVVAIYNIYTYNLLIRRFVMTMCPAVDAGATVVAFTIWHTVNNVYAATVSDAYIFTAMSNE